MLEEHGKQLVESNVFAKEDNLPISKQVFYKLVAGKIERIEKLQISTDFNSLRVLWQKYISIISFVLPLFLMI